MKKALIVTYYWPPAGGSGVQRWLKFVKYLRDFKVEPVVYTVQNPNYPIIDESLQNDIPKGIEVLTQPIWEPNDVLNFFGNKKQESAGFLNSNPSFFGKILQYIRANYFIPDARKFWIKPSVKFLKKYVNKHKIDTIITTGPPHSVHLIGMQLKEQLGVKWIADFRDPWTEIDYFHQLPLTKSSQKKHFFLEEKVLKLADAVVVVGETMKRNFKKFNKNTITITNGYDSEISENNINLDAKFTVTHIGLMNADRNPKMLWLVLSEIINENENFKNDFELKLIGKVDNSVMDAVADYKLTKNVSFINYLSHKEVVEYQKKSQVLLLVVNNVPSAKGIITGKIFEYLMAKRPILAIAPIDGDLNEIIRKTDSGIVVGFDDAKKLKKSVLDFYEAYKKNRLQISSKNIAQYHRKELTKELSKLIYTITE